MPRKIERPVFRVIAFVLFAFAFAGMLWPRVWAGVSDCVFLSATSVLLIFLGTYQLGITRERAEAISEELAKSPFRRLWLPARFYTSSIVFWQFRVLSIMIIVMGLMTAYTAVLAHRRGL